MTKKEKLEYKIRLIDKCRSILLEKANNAKQAMDDHQQMANEYGGPKDRYDSFRMQMLRKKDMFAIQYQKFIEEINIYDKIDTSILNSEVSFGSIVFTNKQNMFVCTGLGKIEFEKSEHYIISAQVPFFKAMLSLKINNKFKFNNSYFEILDIF